MSLYVNSATVGRHAQTSPPKGRTLLIAHGLTPSHMVSLHRTWSLSIAHGHSPLLQKMIRTEFQHCTVITIAHRIETIVDSDYILVMDDGSVAEFAPPDELLKRENGLFAALVKGAS